MKPWDGTGPVVGAATDKDPQLCHQRNQGSKHNLLLTSHRWGIHYLTFLNLINFIHECSPQYLPYLPVPICSVQPPSLQGFPGSSAGKESTCSAGDPSLIPGSGRSSGEGIGYPLQYSWDSLVAQTVKNPPVMWETWVRFLGWEDPRA